MSEPAPRTDPRAAALAITEVLRAAAFDVAPKWNVTDVQITEGKVVLTFEAME